MRMNDVLKCMSVCELKKNQTWGEITVLRLSLEWPNEKKQIRKVSKNAQTHLHNITVLLQYFR